MPAIALKVFENILYLFSTKLSYRLEIEWLKDDKKQDELRQNAGNDKKYFFEEKCKERPPLKSDNWWI